MGQVLFHQLDVQALRHHRPSQNDFEFVELYGDSGSTMEASVQLSLPRMRKTSTSSVIGSDHFLDD